MGALGGHKARPYLQHHLARVTARVAQTPFRVCGSCMGFLSLLGLGSGFAEVSNLDQFLFQRVSALPPGVKAPLQRAYAGYPLAFEEQRHTGAGGFARSSAVEHDVAIAGNLHVTVFDFLGVQVDGAG